MLLQCLQEYISPAWIREWRSRPPLFENPLPQTLQVNVFGPTAWFRTCLARLVRLRNTFPQYWHGYGRSSVWLFMCFRRYALRLNVLLHTVHTNCPCLLLTGLVLRLDSIGGDPVFWSASPSLSAFSNFFASLITGAGAVFFS